MVNNSYENISNRTNNANSSFLEAACIESHEAKQWKFFVAGIQCLIISFTLLGNGLVVGAVASYYRLRSVTNYFVVSLALADLTVAVFVMPYSVLYDLWDQWIFGWVVCYFWCSCDVMCCTASILHLCVIAVDRYLAITEPLTYANRLSSRRAGLIIAAVWACSAAISFVPIYMGWFADDTIELYTHSSTCGLHVNKIYAVLSSSTSFYLPLVVMVIVYARIFCIAHRQSKEIVKLEKSVERDGGGGRSHASARRNAGRDRKAIKTLGTLMGLFFACWFPFFIVYVIRPFYKPEVVVISPFLVMTITWLGYCNSFINPCVYALMNHDFRFAYKRLILCQKANHVAHRRAPLTLDLTREQNRDAYNLVTHDCVDHKDLLRASVYELK